MKCKVGTAHNMMKAPLACVTWVAATQLPPPEHRQAGINILIISTIIVIISTIIVIISIITVIIPNMVCARNTNGTNTYRYLFHW